MKEKFTTVERNATSIAVVNQIIQMIADGQLHAGEKLPSERQLQDLLKVGRPSIREALSALQIMHICETRIGDGTYITSLDPQDMTKPFEILMLLSKPSLNELFDMREILEVGAIRLAVQNLTTEELDELVECVKRAREIVDNSHEFAKVDTQLHMIIVGASRNSLMKNIMYSLHHMSSLSRGITSVFAEVRHQAVKDHQEIVEALLQHDVIGAENAMRKHLQNVQKSVTDINGEILTKKIKVSEKEF